jgi:hypothetical protein
MATILFEQVITGYKQLKDYMLQFRFLMVSDSGRRDGRMMENSESEEDIEEVKEDNVEAAKKQHSSKARGKK